RSPQPIDDLHGFERPTVCPRANRVERRQKLTVAPHHRRMGKVRLAHCGEGHKLSSLMVSKASVGTTGLKQIAERHVHWMILDAPEVALLPVERRTRRGVT